MTMPDECNFDSVTYALKLESRVPFRGVDSIIILVEKSEMTLESFIKQLHNLSDELLHLPSI